MIDARALIESLPHRPPFRFVDDVLAIDDARVVTTYRADEQADFFKGHYPQSPIMPGVLIGEACFQAGALLMVHRANGKLCGGVPVLTRIRDARFKQIVRPPQRLRIEVLIDEQLDNVAYMTGHVTVRGASVLRISFCCMVVEKGE